MLELISALEERFGIELEAELVTAQNFADVAALSDVVETLSR